MEMKIILLLSPVIIIQLGLMLWGILKIIPKEKTKYLNKNIWLLIIILVSMFGPIAYLILEGDD